MNKFHKTPKKLLVRYIQSKQEIAGQQLTVATQRKKESISALKSFPCQRPIQHFPKRDTKNPLF